MDSTVGDLLFVHGYHPQEHDEDYGPTHKLTLVFECELADSTTPALPADPDPNQTGVEWLPLETIEDEPLRPDLGQRWEAIASGEIAERYLDWG